MAKISRKMGNVGQAQMETEKNADKFSETAELALAKTPLQVSQGRISPQISCTVSQEDRLALNELTLHLSNKAGKILNTSAVIRSLIRLGQRRKEELEA